MKRITGILLLIILFSSVFIDTFAQIKESQNTSVNSSSMSQQSQFKLNSTSVNADATQLLSSIQEPSAMKPYPVEGVVEMDSYIVGQGDIFNLGLYGYLNQVIPLTVSLEGSLIIPSVGEVNVSGITLKKAKEKVIAAVKKRYYNSDVSFTLLQPRSFLIQVSGLSQGTYTVTSLTRSSQVLSMILFDTLNYQRRIEEKKYGEFLPQYSFRNIELYRKDGSKTRVDIYRFFSSKQDKYNPYLREGDLLKIPNLDFRYNSITVYGAVQLPGHYEYAPDDNLESVIGLGRGFDLNAEPDSILLYRIDERNKFVTINLNYEKDKDFKINLYDRIFVKYKTDYMKMISVKVEGEIVRPGTYPIIFKNTRLKDVIEMAGGFTKNAYLPLCIIFRSFDEEYTRKDTMEVIINRRVNDLIKTDKDKLNFEEDVRGRRNRVVVDFEKLFKENDESQDIIIEDKDIIYINDNKNSVYVYGQVQNEGYVSFKEGENFKYYVEKAGGFSLAADESDTRVIKFNSRGWYKPDEVKINSGDFIYVPKKTSNTFAENITIVAQIASVVIGVITTYILIKNTQK